MNATRGWVRWPPPTGPGRGGQAGGGGKTGAGVGGAKVHLSRRRSPRVRHLHAVCIQGNLSLCLSDSWSGACP